MKNPEIIIHGVKQDASSDSNSKAIIEVFNQFITAITSDNFSTLSQYLVSDVKAVFSTAGTFEGIDSVIEGLKWKGPHMDIRKCLTSNYTAFYQGDKAQQTAYVHSLYVQNEERFYPFEFGGHFVNSYVKTEEGWKLSIIRYDLDWEKGNTSFAENWNLIDYKMYGGHPLSAVHEYDSPWIVIPKPENVYTEEELVAQTMYRYAEGLDNFNFKLFETSCTNEVVFNNGRKVLYGNLRDLIAGFRQTRHKEATMQHSLKVFDVQVNGDEATLRAHRLEPHRLGSKTLCIDNYRYTFYTAKYFNRLKKVNGVWKLYEINYNAGVFFEVEPAANNYID